MDVSALTATRCGRVWSGATIQMLGRWWPDRRSKNLRRLRLLPPPSPRPEKTGAPGRRHRSKGREESTPSRAAGLSGCFGGQNRLLAKGRAKKRREKKSNGGAPPPPLSS